MKEKISEIKIQNRNQVKVLKMALDIAWDLLDNKEESIFKLGKNKNFLNKSEIHIVDQFKILWRSKETDEKLFKNIKKIFYIIAEYSKLTSEEKFPLLFRFDDYDLTTIKVVCDVISRTMMGQIDNLFYLKDSYCEIYNPIVNQLKSLLFPDLTSNMYYAIHSPKISDDARILMDIHQCIRFYLSWRDVENTPATRDWKTQFTVNYDYPSHFSEEPLIEVKEIKK